MYCYNNTGTHKAVFEALQYTQLVVGVLGLIFNALIISLFMRNKQIRNNIPNTLLFNQALMDSWNCLFFIFFSSLKLRHCPVSNKTLWWIFFAADGCYYLSTITSTLSGKIHSNFGIFLPKYLPMQFLPIVFLICRFHSSKIILILHGNLS